jgi:oxygen-independent coproporphyrinogen-3 oxidase
LLYLHIPYCKQACSYCNFHFSTNLKTRTDVLGALIRELEVRREELPSGPVPTIYFGGGTPSLLTEKELHDLFAALESAGYYDPATEQEITLEANPDDLTPTVIKTLARSPINRLSIGIQSFSETDLRFMNRAHDAEQALQAVDRARSAGIDNLSIDLIYGGQTTDNDTWQRNLDIATSLAVDHVAAYALTVEPGTALGHRVAMGTTPDTSDDRFDRQLNMLIDHLSGAGYEHYEISNFARPGRRSRHNSGYWTGQAYLGVGPGAHSFDGNNTRRWNVSNNARYARVWRDIDAYVDFRAAGPLLYEEETLTDRDRYNEFVMTGLRRTEGIDTEELTTTFGERYRQLFVREIGPALQAGHIYQERNVYRLSRAGIPYADGIAAAAFAPPI